MKWGIIIMILCMVGVANAVLFGSQGNQMVNGTMTDTNESTRMNAAIANNCGGTDKMVGLNLTGGVECAADVSAAGGGNSTEEVIAAVNNTGLNGSNFVSLMCSAIVFDNGIGSAEICDGDDEDDDTQYTENSPYLTLVGTVFGFDESQLNQTIDARDSDTTYSALSEFDNDVGFFSAESNLTALLDDNYADISVVDTDTYTNETQVDLWVSDNGYITDDTNESTRVNAAIADNCGGTDKMIGLNTTGGVECAADIDTDTKLSEDDVEGYIFDSDNTATLDMNNYGIINVNSLNVSGVSWFDNNIMPKTTLTHDIGSGEFRWDNLYVADISADEFVATGNVTGDFFYGDGLFLTNLNITNGTINADNDINILGYTLTSSYLAGVTGSMDMRGDPWYMANGLEVLDNVDFDSNANVDGNLTVGEKITANDWSNVTITVSQITDFASTDTYTNETQVDLWVSDNGYALMTTLATYTNQTNINTQLGTYANETWVTGQGYLTSYADTNESTRFNKLVAYDCAAGYLVIGINTTGGVLCALDSEGAGADTNESTRFNALAANDCGAGYLVIGVNDTGGVKCAADTDSDTTYSALSEFDNDVGFFSAESNLTALLDDNYADISVVDTDTYTNETQVDAWADNNNYLDLDTYPNADTDSTDDIALSTLATYTNKTLMYTTLSTYFNKSGVYTLLGTYANKTWVNTRLSTYTNKTLLSTYANKTIVNTQLSTYLNKSAANTLLSTYANETWVTGQNYYDSVGDIPKASIVNDDITHMANNNQIYDFVMGLNYITTDTNESTRMNAAIADNCGGTDKMVGLNLTGGVECAADVSAAGGGNSTEQMQDAAGALLGGTETGISVTYDDANNDIDFVVQVLPSTLSTYFNKSGVYTLLGTYANKTWVNTRLSTYTNKTLLSTYANKTIVNTQLGTYANKTWVNATVGFQFTAKNISGSVTDAQVSNQLTINTTASIQTNSMSVVCNAAKTACWKTYVDAGGNLITLKT